MRETHGLSPYSTCRRHTIPFQRHDSINRILCSLPCPNSGPQSRYQHLLPQQRHLRTPSAQRSHPSHLKKPTELRFFRSQRRNRRHIHRWPAGSPNHHRTIRLNYPQPYKGNRISTDNSTAKGVLTANLRQKLSKSFNMRYW